MAGLSAKRLARAVGLVGCSLLLGALCSARADDSPPAAVDEHAAYCVPVIQRQLQEAHALLDTLDKKLKDPKTTAEVRKQIEGMETDAQQRLAQMEKNMERMRAVSDIQADDSKRGTHASAQEQGAHDIGELGNMLNRCAGKCYATGASIDKCEDECQDKKLLARVKSCFMPAWLP